MCPSENFHNTFIANNPKWRPREELMNTLAGLGRRGCEEGLRETDPRLNIVEQRGKEEHSKLKDQNRQRQRALKGQSS